MSELAVKICGITTAEDAVAARELGADYRGLHLSQGFPRSMRPDEAADIGLVAEAGLVACLGAVSADWAARCAASSRHALLSMTLRKPSWKLPSLIKAAPSN